MRILNADVLTSHGNIVGRRAVVDILEAGMQAADPYGNTRSLLRLDGEILSVGNRVCEPSGDPNYGHDEVVDLGSIGSSSSARVRAPNGWRRRLKTRSAIGSPVALSSPSTTIRSSSAGSRFGTAPTRFPTRAEFESWGHRIFGMMLGPLGMLPTAERMATELGFTPHRLTSLLVAEAREIGVAWASIAENCLLEGKPFQPPCALISGGELIVTVGR